MSIAAIDRVFKTCPEKGSHYLVLIALADQANDDGHNIWFRWDNLAHKARVTTRTARLVVEDLLASQRLTVEMGAAPRGYDLYHITFPSGPYTRADFERDEDERKLAKRAAGKTRFGIKKGQTVAEVDAEATTKTPRKKRSEKSSQARLSTKSEAASQKSEYSSQKSEDSSLEKGIAAAPSAGETTPEPSLTLPLIRPLRGVLGTEEEQKQNVHTASEPERGSAPLSSENAALQKTEAGPVIDSLADLPLPHLPSSQTLVLEQPAPGGVSADADGDALVVTDEDAEALFASGASIEALEKVPGGAAGAAAEAPRGPGQPAVTLSVAELLPIPPTELASRPAASPESEVWKALREVLGKSMPTYLSETTRTGNLSRELWLKLTAPEIRHVTLTARLEASTSKDNMITLAVRGLDRLIGAVKARSSEGNHAPPGEKVLGPVDLSHLDPHLPPGARCTVGSRLGVVQSVRQNGYIVELDGGDLITLDRFVAGQLTSLKASTEPLVAAVTGAEDVVVLAKVGTVYRELATGAVVEVKAVQGANRVLSTGHTIACYQLVNSARFERLSA